MRYDSSERFCLIAAACLQNVGPVSLRKILKLAGNHGTGVAAISRFSATELQNEAGIGALAAAELAALDCPVERGRRMSVQLESRGVEMIWEDEDRYPASLTEHLGREAPLVLFTGGCATLLISPSIAVVGSRRPSRQAAEAARCFSADLARHGWTIVSGAAAGIDSCGHSGALSEGNTIFLPPEGVLRFGGNRMAGTVLDKNNWCLASQFPPSAGWKTQHALIRNRLITALGSAVVAFEPRDRGGTWHSSNMALKMRKPLFVASFRDGKPQRDGRERLLKRGAVALDCSRMPAAEEFGKMLLAFEAPPRERQNPLFPDKDPELPGP